MSNKDRYTGDTLASAFTAIKRRRYPGQAGREAQAKRNEERWRAEYCAFGNCTTGVVGGSKYCLEHKREGEDAELRKAGLMKEKREGYVRCPKCAAWRLVNGEHANCEKNLEELRELIEADPEDLFGV